MDEECIAICEAINKIPDIYTIESCCGHNEKEFRIWFKVDDLDQLPHLLYWVDGCHSGFYGWRVEIRTDCSKQYPTFCLIGPIGAYEEAAKIAKLIDDDDERK